MARGEATKSDSQVREAQYGFGEKVWVGQSRGSMREGTVVGYLGEGSYSVFIAEGGVRTVAEGLLSLRQEDRDPGGQAPEGLLAEAGWRAADTEKRSLVEQRRMRWYNPKLENFEWRAVPKSDETALALLDDYPTCERCAEVYEEWRALGAPIIAALIRAGEMAKEELQDHQAGAPTQREGVRTSASRQFSKPGD